jgi:hypothetical protein
MRISDAIDYIVNDSSAKVKQPSSPKLAEYGPARGYLMIQRGVEHEDARRLINDQLIAGHLRCWGKRQILGYHSTQFESAVREIDRRDWENMQLTLYGLSALSGQRASNGNHPREGTDSPLGQLDGISNSNPPDMASKELCPSII